MNYNKRKQKTNSCLIIKQEKVSSGICENILEAIKKKLFTANQLCNVPASPSVGKVVLAEVEQSEGVGIHMPGVDQFMPFSFFVFSF